MREVLKVSSWAFVLDFWLETLTVSQRVEKMDLKKDELSSTKMELYCQTR